MNRNQQTNADITVLLKARNTCLWIVTREEARVEAAIVEAAGRAKYDVTCWDCADGFTLPSGQLVDGNVRDAFQALEYIGNRKKRGVYVMRDLHRWSDPLTVRKLRNLARSLKSDGQDEARSVIVLAPTAELPPELVGQVIVIDYPLPEREEVGRMLDDALSGMPTAVQETAKASVQNGAREVAIDAALGLSAEEIESCYAKSLVTSRRIEPGLISAEKRRVVSRTPGLTWYEPDARGLDAIGGLGELKAWLTLRKLALSRKAREFGLPFPKGVFLAGVPGSGKSLAAKCVPAAWGLPLLRFDLGGMRSKFVGDSEGNLRRALEIVATVSPCVLWLDEVEKAVASGPQGDGGVAADALGQVLQWMNDQQGTFVIATANDVLSLPPEFVRKGRFDEMFWVDLPGGDDRGEILTATLRQYGRDPKLFSIGALARETEGLTGAEVASLVPDGLFLAFAEDARDLTDDDMIAVAKTIVPLSKTQAEKIDRMRAWAKDNARPAAREKQTRLGTGRNLDL